MAKSIRAKCKKRARTELRKTVGAPHARKLEAKALAVMSKSAKFRSGPQAEKLQKLLRRSRRTNPVVKEAPKWKFAFANPNEVGENEFRKQILVQQPAEEESEEEEEEEEGEESEEEKQGEEEEMEVDGAAPASKPGSHDVFLNNGLFKEGKETKDLSGRYQDKLRKQKKNSRRRDWVFFK